MKLARWLVAIVALGLPLASYADTFAGAAIFSDTSPAHNNFYNFTGTFANPTFNFSGKMGTVYTDALTITTQLTLGWFGNHDNVSVEVDFTNPESVSSGFNGKGTAYFFGLVAGSVIDWADNLQTVTFGDGSSLQLYLPDFNYGATLCGPFGSHTEDLTMTVLTDPTPEPSSLALFGSGLLCLAGLVFRKYAAQ